jgi:hypothetical protein
MPLPSFNKVRNDLLLEELTLNDKAKTPSMAVLSTGNNAAGVLGAAPQHTSAPSGTGTGNSTTSGDNR